MQNRLVKSLVLASAFAPLPALAAVDQRTGASAVGAGANEAALTGPLANIINAIFFVAGAAAVIVLIVGGVGYILSTGDPTRIQKAKNTVLYAIVGLIVVLLARAIVAFIVGRV